MSREVWAEVDARHQPGEVTPLTVVAGLPLLIRVLKISRALGWRGARVLVTADNVATISAAIERHRLGPEFLVELDVGDPESPVTPGGEAIGGGKRISLPLDSRAIYARDMLAEAAELGARAAPEMLVRDRAQAARAQRRLLASTRKNVILDGVVAYFVMRPASRLLTRALVNTGMSQHLVTLLALCTGLMAAFFASRGDRHSLMAAGILYLATGILDCVDGDLARIRLAQSRLGAWLDSLTDEAVTLSLAAGLGLGLARTGAGQYWQWLGFAICALAFLTLGKMYSDLGRKRLPIDTALYPWFFLGDVDPDSAYPPRGFFGRVLFALGFLVRRDANVTMIALLLVFGQAKIALCGIGVVIVAVSLLLLVHVFYLLFGDSSERQY